MCLNNFTYMNKRNIVSVVMFGILMSSFSVMLSSCATTGPKLKADVIGFSDGAITSYNLDTKRIIKPCRKQSKPYNLPVESQVSQTTVKGKKKSKKTEDPEITRIKTFVQDLPASQNTAGYYALDLALDRIKYVRRNKDIMNKDPFSKYYIITLTDGLDNISTQVARNNKQRLYTTNEKYVKRLNRRMKKATKSPFINWGRPNDFVAYCLAYTGTDLGDIKTSMEKTPGYDPSAFQNVIQEQMDVFTGAGGNMKEPPVMQSDNLGALFAQLEEELKDASFEFQVPKSYANKRIRMTLTGENNDTIFLEGKYKRGLFGNCKLVDIKMIANGHISYAGDEYKQLRAQNLNRKDLTSIFRLNSLKYQKDGTKRSGNFKVVNSSQAYKDEKMWIPNVEYRHVANVVPNAYFIFLIDSSESFKDEFQDAKDEVQGLIDSITGNEPQAPAKKSTSKKSTKKNSNKKR